MDKAVKPFLNPQFGSVIQSFSAQNPMAAVFLDDSQYLEEHYFKTSSGQLNVSVDIGDRRTPLFGDHPDQETAKWWKGIHGLEQIQALYIIGVGLGEAYPYVKTWLRENPKRAVIFLENDLELLQYFLQTKAAAEILSDPQVQVAYFHHLEDPVFNDLTWRYFQVNIAVVACPFYAEHKSEWTETVRHKIYHDAAHKNDTIHEYLDGGMAFYSNFYRNALKLPHSYHGNALFGKFPGVPVIICGAGPSLKKNFRVLKSLRDKAVLIAGGSALNSLTAQGLIPHFSIGVDPNPEQLKRLTETAKFKVPFFYRNRMYYKAFQAIQGPRLYLNGAGGYPTPEWLEEKLGIVGEALEEGMNVINFGVEIAKALGGAPIVLVGCDLAFTDEEAYAPGVVAASVNQIPEAQDFESNPILRPDIHGKPVKTLWKWVSEAQWLGEYHHDHPEIRMVNATEGGIGFPGVPNAALAEVSQGWEELPGGIQERIDKAIQQSHFKNLTEQQVENQLKELQRSLVRCDQLISQLMHSGSEVLLEHELSEEEGYVAVLQVFDMVFFHLTKHVKTEIGLQRFSYLKRCVVNHLNLLNEVLK